MPLFKNDREHAVRVQKPSPLGNDRLVRVLPGATLDADGEYADNARAAGLVDATEDDRSAWEQVRRTGAVTAAMGTRLAAKLSLGPQLVGIRQALIVAPLRRVIGDDMAPYGPASGVITTKGAVVGDGSDYEARRAFADNEAVAGQRVPGAGEVDPLMGVAVVPSQAEVHNSQVTNAEMGELAAEAFVQGEVAGAEVGAAQTVGDNFAAQTRATLLERAESEGIDVQGTGSGGYVTKSDLVSALQANAAGEDPSDREDEETAQVLTSSPEEEGGQQEQSAPPEPLPDADAVPEADEEAPPPA